MNVNGMHNMMIIYGSIDELESLLDELICEFNVRQ